MAGDGDGGVFRGMRFRLVGFDEDREDEYRRLIRNADGEIVRKYEWKDLYLITSNGAIRYAEKICLDARKNGAVVLNEFWLDDCLASKAIADINKVLYQPPLSLDGINGAGRLQIDYSGFSPQESSDIERLMELMGASHRSNDKVRRGSSYLICNKPGAEEYKAAREKNAFTVKKQWIVDCVLDWEILSIENYSSWPRDKHQEHQRTSRTAISRSHQTPSKNEIDENVDRKGHFTEKKAKTQVREGRRGGSTEPRNKRPRSPTTIAAPSCRKCLTFQKKSLSEFRRKDLLVKVQIPQSSLEIAMGTDHVKRFFLQSYASIVTFHCEGECIMNHFTAKSFHMSLDSDQVTIDPVQLVPFTEELSSSNKKDFVEMVKELYRDNGYPVPADIAGWLSSIAAGVPDTVLRRHIHMLDPNEILGSFVAIYYLLLRLRRKDWLSYTKIVQSKEFDIYMNWSKVRRPFSWIVLYDSLNYIHPGQLEVYRVKSQQQNSGETLTPPKPKQRDDDVFGLIGLIRDCFFHPALDYQEMLLPVLLTQFPKLLQDLQKVLFALGHLN